MKAFIFDPLWDKLITDQLITELQHSGLELIVTKEIASLSECAAMFEGDEERILCVNPDYVNWKLKSEDYKNIPGLKAIFPAASSFGWVDTTHADTQGIAVCNIRNYSTEAVAEWAITMMFNLTRQVPRLIKDEFPLDYDKDFMNYRGMELYNKRVGIIGLGHIGSSIAKRCKGLGMDVSYWSKSTRVTDYSYVDLVDLFANSDVIFPIMALNDESKSLITIELLKSMKPSAIVVSVASGLFDSDFVLEMVKNNKLFGYGFEASPNSFNNYQGNVWAAPSYAWATDGSMNNSMARWVENMTNAANGNFPNKVN